MELGSSPSVKDDGQDARPTGNPLSKEMASPALQRGRNDTFVTNQIPARD